MAHSSFYLKHFKRTPFPFQEIQKIGESQHICAPSRTDVFLYKICIQCGNNFQLLFGPAVLRKLFISLCIF